MAKGLITFDQYVQEKGFDNKTINRFWKYCNQDIPNKETGQIEWWGSEATNHNDMRGYSEEFDELFEEFKNINSSRQITSAKSQEEFENLVIDIENRLGVNVEHSNIFNLPVELTYEDECYIDDICREQNCKFVPVNGSRRQYRLIQSSRRNNMVKSAYTREDYNEAKKRGYVYIGVVYSDGVTYYVNEDGHLTTSYSLAKAFHTEYEADVAAQDARYPGMQWGVKKIIYNSRQIKSAYTREEIVKMSNEGYRAFFDNKKITDCPYDDNSVEKNYWIEGYKGAENLWNIRESYNPIKSAYTREDYDRFDEVGNFIPYNPTEEELAKKDEIKTVLKQELSDAYEPDPMDDYVGYDSTNERIDMACERVAKQFGVDTDFVEDIAGEIQNEDYARTMAESEWIYKHCTDKDKFWDWQNGEDVSLEELGIDKEQMDKEVNEMVNKYVNSSRQVKSALDTVKVTFDNGDTIVTDYNADVGREEIAKYYMHNYFNVGGEDEMHQVVKVEFPGNINSARVPEVADMQDAEDLALFAENDVELYNTIIKPTFDSLQRKLKRGIYDKNKALIAWEHVIDEAAKAYDRQLGSKRGTMAMFNKATRKEAAKILMDSIWDEDEWQA